MSQKMVLTGMVLSSAPAGDYDRRVVLLTKEAGKIAVFARGSRRQNSPLLAASSPFCFGTFTVYEGRTAYTLVSAEISQYFEQVKADFEATCYGCYFMEFADYYTQENLDASMMLNLLYASLLALGRESLPDRLVRYVFEIRLMVINGEYPQDLAEDEALPEAVRYTLYYAIHAPLQKLYTFVVRNEVLENIAKLQDQIRERYVDRRFHSLELLTSG